MLKPLSSVPVSFSGNIKIQNFVEIHRDYKGKDTDENLYWGTVREARMVPLSSSARYTNLMCNLLTSDYSHDISKFWGVYSDIFFSSEDNSEFTVYELIGNKPSSNYNTDFSWGCKRISFQKNRGCTHTFFAPLWTEGEIPDYFEITVVVDNKTKEPRTLRIPISKNIKPTIHQQPFHYLPQYIERYCTQLDSNVVRLDPSQECSYIYGIDLQRGGFSMAQNRQAQSLWRYYQPVNSFDYTLTYQYKDSKYAVKQILPLAFSFNLDDLLLGNQKFSTNIKISGNYWKNGNKLQLYRFDYNYTDYNFQYYVPTINNRINSSNVVNRYNTTKNIFQLNDKTIPSNFCLYEGTVNQYKNTSQKYVPYYFKWQLSGSSDDFPYIVNLNEEYNQVYQNKLYNLGSEASPNFIKQEYKISGNYHIVPLPVLNTYGLYITKSGNCYYRVLTDNTEGIFKGLEDKNFSSELRTTDLVTEFNNYCNNWYQLPLYRINETQENLCFDNGRLSQVYVAGTSLVENNGLIYYKGILYDLKNTDVKNLRVEHDIKVVDDIYGPCYCIYLDSEIDQNSIKTIYSTKNYLGLFGSESTNNSLIKILGGTSENIKFFINPVSYLSEKEYNSLEDISKPEIISEMVQLPFHVLIDNDDENNEEYFVKVPYLSQNKAQLNLPDYFSLFRNTETDWSKGKNSVYRHKLYKYTTNYDSSTENLFYVYKEVTRYNPGAEDIFYKVKAKKLNIADFKDNSYFYDSEGNYLETKAKNLEQCRIFNPTKASFEDTPVISSTYMTSLNYERFFDEIIQWYKKDSVSCVKNVIYDTKETGNTFNEYFNGILFEDIPSGNFTELNIIPESLLFSEECLKKLNLSLWNNFQKKPKVLFGDKRSWSREVRYCGYYASKQQAEEYLKYVKEVIDENYNFLYNRMSLTKGNVIILNKERKKIFGYLDELISEYLVSEKERVDNLCAYFLEETLKPYFEKLKVQHNTIEYTHRFSPVNNIYDLDDVLDRLGNIYIYAQALYLPQYYNYQEDNDKSFQERLVYGFKLVKENDEYYIEIPEYGYATNKSSFSGVTYDENRYKLKIDIDLLRNKSYISIYWTNPTENLTDILKSYNEFILRYLYPWVGYNIEAPYSTRENSHLTVKYSKSFYTLYKFAPEFKDLEFTLYFVDEFVSFNNLKNSLDKHFYNLLLSSFADARFWYPVTNECDKVIVPRLQHTVFDNIEVETKFIFDHVCQVVSPENCVYIKDEKSEESWDNLWKQRIQAFETELCTSITNPETTYNNDNSLSFFARREMFFNEYYIKSYKYTLPFINISGIKYPWLCQYLPEKLKNTDLSTPEHSFKKFYSVRIPDVRIGLYKNGTKGLLRCNSLITPDENSLNLFSKIKFTGISVKNLVQEQIERNPRDVYFCLKRNPLIYMYDSNFTVKPQYYTLNEDLIVSKNLDNSYSIMNNEVKNQYRFLRYFGHIKPMLVQDVGPVYAWGKMKTDSRQSEVPTTLFKNVSSTINSSNHVEKYVSKEINPVTRKYKYVEKERKLWEDKWYNDSKVLNLPLTITILKGTYKESELNKVESNCQDDFNKYFRQKKFTDPELLKYLFFNYKIEYDTVPLRTDSKGEKEYRLTFKFTLH